MRSRVIACTYLTALLLGRHAHAEPPAIPEKPAAERVSPLDSSLKTLGLVLAVPTTLIGLAYTYMLIIKTRAEGRKLRLEAEKLEFELAEKQSRLPAGGETLSQEVREVIRPIIRTDKVQFILVRCVILYFVLKFYDLIGYVVGTSLGLGLYGFMYALQEGDMLGNLFNGNTMMFVLGSQLFSIIPKAVYWAIFVLLGLPIFRDANRLLNIEISDFFRVNFWKRQATGAADEVGPAGRP